MLGANDEEEYKVYVSKASMMNLNNLYVLRMEKNMSVEECIPALETNDKEFVPSIHRDLMALAFNIPPLTMRAPIENCSKPQGTSVGYTGLFTCTIQYEFPHEPLVQRLLVPQVSLTNIPAHRWTNSATPDRG